MLKFKLFSIIAVLTFCSAYAGTPLTDSQSKHVLKSLDMIGADTFCCGDYNYAFDSITYEKNNSYKLRYKMLSYYSNKRFYNIVCRLDNLNSFNDFIDNVKKGLGDDLNEKFYNSFLYNCVEVAENYITAKLLELPEHITLHNILH